MEEVLWEEDEVVITATVVPPLDVVIIVPTSILFGRPRYVIMLPTEAKMEAMMRNT